MTVNEFLTKTIDSYMDLAICEYKGDQIQRRITADKHKWFCADIPDDLKEKEIASIVPYYSRIVIEVNAE